MNDVEINDLVLPLFDHDGPVKAISDAAWRRRRNALGDACIDTKGAIAAIIQRVEATQSAEIERLRAALTNSERSFNSIRGAIESGQVVDKDAHGTAVRGRDMCRAALKETNNETSKNSMTDEQIKHMVEQFLRWQLPENFNPDGGISFKKMFNENTPHPMKAEPSGTNLFDYEQATEMVRYMLEGLPEAEKDLGPGRPVQPHRSGGGHWVGD